MTKAELEQELRQQKLLVQKARSLYIKNKERIEEIEKLYAKQQRAFSEANKLSNELSILINTFKDIEQEVIKEYD